MKERGSEPQPPLAAGQPSHAADSESSCQCGGQTQRKHLRDSLSPLRATSRTQSNHWNNCPQTLSLGLEDIAPRNPLRGTRPRSQQSVQAKAHPKNDPSTPQAWLPNRTEPFSISHHSMTRSRHGFRPCVYQALRLVTSCRRSARQFTSCQNAVLASEEKTAG